MPIDPQAARCFRLVSGAGIATMAAYGAALQLGYLLIVLVVTLLSVPVPPPGAKGAIVLAIATAVTALYGMLLGPVLTYVPVAGVMLSLGGVALATVVSRRPGTAIIGTLMILSSTIVAVFAAQSSAAAAMLVRTLIGSMIGAVIIAHIAHALFPEPAKQAPPAPPAAAAPVQVAWIAVRSALIMLPPLLAALTNPAAYIMLLMKGASLAQQADSDTTRAQGLNMAASTAAGGVAAMLFWWLLSLWPNLVLLTLGMMLAALVMARPMFGAIGSRFRPDWWQFAMTTMIILIGPAVADTASAENIQRQMLIRIATFIGLALYAAAAVHLLDRLRNRKEVMP
jgi:hypothetical protein